MACGLGVWSSLRMREVSSSNLGQPQFLHEEDPRLVRNQYVDRWKLAGISGTRLETVASPIWSSGGVGGRLVWKN